MVEDEVDFDKINVGCTVKVYDITFDEEIEFKIVGSTEANSLEGKISNESPVGQALIGKKVGDVGRRRDTGRSDAVQSTGYSDASYYKRQKGENNSGRTAEAKGQEQDVNQLRKGPP